MLHNKLNQVFKGLLGINAVDKLIIPILKIMISTCNISKQTLTV